MEIASKAADRKHLVKALEEETGLKAKYCGAPSFSYEIGPYTVDRAGNLVVEDAEATDEVLQSLAVKGLIDFDDEKKTATIISLPTAGHDGRSLRNLVFMLHSKGALLSKAVGKPGLYRVSKKLVADLDAGAPQSIEDFLTILGVSGDGALQGITIEPHKICFYFPMSEDSDRIRTYMQLAVLMGKAAREQKRVQPDKCKDTNEKYTFRVWLMRLGMMGEEYKDARRILLRNLKGNGAFRTKSQEETAREKLKKQREEAREAAEEMAFERL